MTLRTPERLGRFLGLWTPEQFSSTVAQVVWIPIDHCGPIGLANGLQFMATKVWVDGNDFIVAGSPREIVAALRQAFEEWMAEDYPVALDATE